MSKAVSGTKVNIVDVFNYEFPTIFVAKVLQSRMKSDGVFQIRYEINSME
jgi:hypothetical protein